MKKKEYLNNIEQFLEYVVGISNEFIHSYYNKRRRKIWHTSGLLAAAGDAGEIDNKLTGYDWKFGCLVPNAKGEFESRKGKTLNESASALKDLSTYLSKQLEDENNLGAFLACQSVLVWGDVWLRGNDKRLYNKAFGLAKTLKLLQTKLASHQSDEADDEQLAKLINEQFWMNSGSTKIFSILLPDFCIYDGRVGAALGMLVRKYCSANNLSTVPEELAFPWGVGKGEKVNDSRRNPSDDKLRFPELHDRAVDHAIWNIRANWLLKELAKRLKIENKDDIGAVRRLEAALFMIGYDVSGSVTANANGAKGKQASKQASRNKPRAASTRSERNNEETKMARAQRVYSENPGLGRQQMLRKFMAECGLTENGASTYYSNIKKENA